MQPSRGVDDATEQKHEEPNHLYPSIIHGSLLEIDWLPLFHSMNVNLWKYSPHCFLLPILPWQGKGTFYQSSLPLLAPLTALLGDFCSRRLNFAYGWKLDRHDQAGCFRPDRDCCSTPCYWWATACLYRLAGFLRRWGKWQRRRQWMRRQRPNKHWWCLVKDLFEI